MTAATTAVAGSGWLTARCLPGHLSGLGPAAAAGGPSSSELLSLFRRGAGAGGSSLGAASSSFPVQRFRGPGGTPLISIRPVALADGGQQVRWFGP